MKKKILTLIAVCVISGINATANLSLTLIRSGKTTFGSSIPLELHEKPLFLYQDATTYIEAELVADNDLESTFQLTVATKAETGAYVVRGLPKLTVFYNHKLGMSSLQCEGNGETFFLVIGASKP